MIRVHSIPSDNLSRRFTEALDTDELPNSLPLERLDVHLLWNAAALFRAEQTEVQRAGSDPGNKGRARDCGVALFRG